MHKPRVVESGALGYLTARNNNLRLGQSLFRKLQDDEAGIGERLSPGRYKLLQGSPDLEKRLSHVNTFNGRNKPLTWNKKLATKVRQMLNKEEIKRSRRLPALIHGSVSILSQNEKESLVSSMQAP